jgi:hypothetical protein
MAGEAMDQEWAGLAGQAPEQREARMIEQCRAVAALDDDARVQAIAAMVRAEYALPATDLHAFTLSRLRAWIAIEHEDREIALRLARGYDTVFQTMPGEMAMRRSSVVQGVARNDLSGDEVTTLFALIPSIIQQVPRMQQDTLSARTAPKQSKPWWRFW